MGKPEGKRPLGRPRRRSEDNIKMYLKYIVDRMLGGPQNGSGLRGEEKILYPYRDSNSDPSAVQPVASRYCTILALFLKVLISNIQNSLFLTCLLHT
jgi:hypothetical protein